MPEQFIRYYNRITLSARFFAAVFGLLFLAHSAAAQTPTPTPAPTATPEVKDAQNVQPENLKGVPQIAPQFESNDKSLPELGRVGVDMMSQKPLTVKEAITLALENNKDIEVTRQDVRRAEFDLRAARGVYEPKFTGQTFYERATVPNISFFTPDVTKTTTDSIGGNAGFQAYVPRFGTVLNATVNNQRIGSDNPVSIISPQYNTNFNFTVAQPLFRGRGFDQNRRTIEIAKRNLSLTDTQFRQRSIETITNVQRAYWDLTYALRNLQVQRDTVKDAKDQLEHNRRLVEEGQLAPIDIVAAETQVANFEQAVYEALNQVQVAENNLKNLIAKSKDDPLWSESLVPTDSVDLDAPTTTLPEALQAALQNRPELEVNNVQKDINEIDQRFYREQTKPQIDLTASYTSAGVGGSLNPNFTNPLLRPCVQGTSGFEECVRQQQLAQANQQILLQNVGGAGTTFTDILANRYPTVRVGVTFNLPLFGNDTAKAQLGKSLVEADKIRTQREQLEQLIQVDVRNTLQAVRTAEARLRAAAISRENSAKQYESEQRKLDAGQTDIYKVLERQTALAAARASELRAQTELNKAIAELQRATGNSLKANNVEARLRK
jgi:outer membrane protein